ncbi:hypothetical protein EAG_03175 [Camponotus floridanus]|uniref:Uncharacterized protein n=1 Tax=Camponotus floridanus TaxID=104421 RepID=E2ADB0_CAMFO|nr:hypothetical protein EAG_03175 [Camponotus floridanus]
MRSKLNVSRIQTADRCGPPQHRKRKRGSLKFVVSMRPKANAFPKPPRALKRLSQTLVVERIMIGQAPTTQKDNEKKKASHRLVAFPEASPPSPLDANATTNDRVHALFTVMNRES